MLNKGAYAGGAEGAFSDVVDGLINKTYSGGKPPDPQITMVLLGDKYSKHCSSGKLFEDQTYPCGETYMYKDVPSEDLLLVQI